MVREWLKPFFRFLLKYRGIVSLAGAAEKVLAMSKNIRRIHSRYPDLTVVTVPLFTRQVRGRSDLNVDKRSFVVWRWEPALVI